MKTLLTAIALFTASTITAQIVNIPDPNFKYLLLHYNPVIDTNGDGEIQETEALAVKSLTIYEGLTYDQNHIVYNTAGLKEFKNIETLSYLSRSPAMDISGLTKLKSLSFTGTFDGVSYTTVVDMSGCTSVEAFYSQNSSLTSLNMNGCKALKSANFAGTNMEYFNPGILENLKDVEMSGNLDVNIDLTGCKNIETINGQNGINLVSLNLSGLKKLRSFMHHGSGELKVLNLSGCESLDQFYNYLSYKLTDIDVSGCTSMTSLALSNTKVSSLDLSRVPNLRALYLYGYDDINHSRSAVKYLNLKNGSKLSEMSITVADSAAICADEFEIDELRSKIMSNINLPDMNNLNSIFTIDPYCNPVPGGRYNTVSGQINVDLNRNGCDPADQGMSFLPIVVKDTAGRTSIQYTSASGDYQAYLYKGRFTLTPYLAYPYFTVSPPSSNTVSFDTANSLANTTDFCILPDGIHNDLEISFLPGPTVPRPGFNTTYQLIYKNRGTTTLSGNVQLNYDNSKINFLSSSTATSSQNAGQLNWSYNNLQPFETKVINVTFNLLPPPVNNLGDTLTYLATIDPAAGDETPYDNVFILPQRIRGSYDPNDKLCLEGDKLDIGSIGKPLHYVIHFQNVGDDTAFNVVVTDTLSNKLDWNSFEFIGSSHPCTVKQTNNRLEFIFENIKLPYKSINDAGSNGFVSFKIKPKNTAVVGDSLNNKAAIYFDFNLPVITNIATTIVSSVGSPTLVKVEYFAGNNSGAANILNWKAACTNGAATFNIERSIDGINFISIGTLTGTAVRCQSPFDFTDKQPVAGKNHYRLKITDANGLAFYSKVVVIGMNKPGFKIKTIITNKNTSAVYFNASRQQTIQVKVIAADGRMIYAGNTTITAGNSQINLPLKNTGTGIYVLIIQTGDKERIIERFIK